MQIQLNKFAIKLDVTHRVSSSPLCILLAICCLYIVPSSGYAKTTVTVLFPDIRAPYRQLFTSIIDDVARNKSLKIKTRAIRKNEDIGSLSNWIKRKKPQGLLVLGQRSTRIALKLDNQIPTLYSAILTPPTDLNKFEYTLSFTPSPEALFRYLHRLAPNVESITVVYSSDNAWLIEQAKPIAKEMDLKFTAHLATTVQQAAKFYKKVLKENRPLIDALWLPHDAITVNEEAIVPTVLAQAWKANLAIFSSSLSHVKRGVLFSLYPDKTRLGKELSEKMADLVNPERRKNTQKKTALAAMRKALNTRTAKHMGLNIDEKLIEEFDLVFPQR